MYLRLRKNRQRFIVLILFILFLAWSAVFIYNTSFVSREGERLFSLFDDAMISMRYGWNFSHGEGLVWNRGERVEGYSNLLMTLLMSLITFFFGKSESVLVVQITGTAFVVLIALVIIHISNRLSESNRGRDRAILGLLCAFAVLTYYPLLYWSLLGMETGILTLLISLAVLCVIRSESILKSRFAIGCGLFIGLAYLARADSIIYSPLLFALILTQRPQHPIVSRYRLRQILFLGTPALAAILGQAVFRWNYYHELVPNTYILKLTGMPLLFRLNDGWNFTFPFLKGFIVILLVIAVDLILNFKRRKLYLFSFLGVAFLYQIWIGGDPWDYWRILVPAIPITLVLFVHGVFRILTTIKSFIIYRGNLLKPPRISFGHTRTVLLPLMVVISVVTINKQFLGEYLFLEPIYHTEHNIENVQTAIAINQLTRSDATVAVFWAGAIPYYTDRYAIDLLGRTDKHIATLTPDLSGKVSWGRMQSVPGHNKYDLEYSIERVMPTFVQGFYWGNQDISEWADGKYDQFVFRGVKLNLLEDSQLVRWDLLDDP